MYFSTNYQISLLNPFLYIKIPISQSQHFCLLHLPPFPLSPSGLSKSFPPLYLSPSSLHNSSFLYFLLIPSPLLSFLSLLSSFLLRHTDPPFVSLLGSRPITSGCGSMERLRPQSIAGWSWRNPSRSSWTSLAMSLCSSSESCSTCRMFRGWSKKPPGKESSNTTYSMSDTRIPGLLHATTAANLFY